MLKLPDTDAVRVFGRRLVALVYDSLLLFAVLFFASLPPILLSGGAIRHATPAYQLYLLAISYVFLGWQWTHGGQTLGMKAWRLKLVAADGSALDWRRALWRFLAALVSLAALGLGYAWLLFDRDRLAWHDRWSGTRVIVLPK